MRKQDLVERLKSLVNEDRPQSKTAHLRGVIDEVEKALAAGVPRARLRAELADCGLSMSKTTFDTTLKRLRKEKHHDAQSLAVQPAKALPARPKPAKTHQSVPDPVSRSMPGKPSPQAETHCPESKSAIADLDMLERLGKRTSP